MNQKLKEFKASLSPFDLGAVTAMAVDRQNQELDDNPYEPGFTEFDRFNEGWFATRDGVIDELKPSLRKRYEAAKRGDDRNEGLKEKYRVDRVDGKPIKDGCIVLEWSDPNARKGIAAFAKAVREDGYVRLADELEERLASY